MRPIRSRAAAAALLLFVCLALFACATRPDASEPDRKNVASRETTADSRPEETTKREETAKKEEKSGEQADAGEGTTVKSILPEDVLSEEELEKGPPEYRGWNAPASEDYEPGTAEFFVTSESSTGAIPAVKPFNFGRDPGGPEDKTLYLTVPKLGLTDVPVFNSLTEEKLTESTVHVPATGFPWQEGANVFIAGHRLGYAGTGSFRIFYDVPSLAPGDEIILEDSAGGVYVYRVTEQVTVGPENVEVMNPVEGKSVVSLQTCTLPDYSERIIVQGELVEHNA